MDLGFNPEKEGRHYFISYRREDAEQVGAICRCLNDMGIPLWYDNDIKRGAKWSKEIARNIAECEMVIMFLTRELFADEKTYVKKEFSIASLNGKDVGPVWLDDFDPKHNKNDNVPFGLQEWYVDLVETQGVYVAGKSIKDIAEIIVEKFNLKITSRLEMSSSAVRPSRKEELDTQSIRSVPEPATFPDTHGLRPGDKLCFGRYPQGLNGEVEPLSWRVLEVDEKHRRALLITEKLIDQVKYNESLDNVDWEASTLSAWVNETFMSKAFTKTEQARIVQVQRQMPDTPDSNEERGQLSSFRVFCLSIEEACRLDYFKDNLDRRAVLTLYGVERLREGITRLNHESNGKWVLDDWTLSLPSGDRAGWWWLRTSGINGISAAYVHSRGSIHKDGYFVILSSVSVRPALWLSL